MTTWTIVRYLHLVALAFFVGGQLMLATGVAPAVRRHGSEEAMRDVAKRFGIGSVIALVTLLATGIAMATHFDLWGDSLLQVKLAVVALIVVLTGLHVVWPRSRVLSIGVLLASLVVVLLGVQLAHG